MEKFNQSQEIIEKKKFLEKVLLKKKFSKEEEQVKRTQEKSRNLKNPNLIDRDPAKHNSNYNGY